METAKLLLRIAGWFLVVFSLVLVVVAFFLYLHTRNFVASATRAQGTVTQLIERTDHDESTAFYPVYQFQDSQGAQHTVYFATACFIAYYFSGHSGIYLSQRLGISKHHQRPPASL